MDEKKKFGNAGIDRVNYFLLLFFVFNFFAHASFAQEKETDTLTITTEAMHRANHAALLSAVIPGAGQIYNEKYWKVPLLYGGFAALAYFINFNQKNYKTFKTAYLYRIDNDSSTVDAFPNYTVNDLLVRKDYYRHNRDLCYIITGVVYVLNIVDAYVDAHLKDFDVGDDLTLKTQPYLNLSYNGMPVAGVSLCLRIGK